MTIKFVLQPQDVKVLKNALKEYAVGKGKKTQYICEDLLGLIEYQEKREKEQRKANDGRL